MKKILIIIVLFSIFTNAKSQLSGNGTYASPWSGTLSGDASWSGTKYINGDITVDNELLTISPGAIIIFLAESADLIITGTGQLNATGTSGSMIRFTSDDDNDGNYGETGENWGHISFQSMGAAGASSITYCIIEYGRKAGAIGTLESAGGGLQVDLNNITISDNIFRNNYAFFGGGLFINASRTPSVTRCLFKNNSVREAGGGIYVYNSSTSVITDCIFDGNYSKGQSASNYSGGGVQFGTSITSAKVINSTFVNNTSDRTGDSFYTLSGGSVINCILWGTSDQTGFYTSSGTVSYSAIQGYVAGSHFSNCFNLNATNSASDGPNFNATDGSDWSIKYISPCRDAGTTPTPTVPTDYVSKNRIYTYDIGAYEVQYSRWTGTTSTTWATTTNWDQSVDPSSGTGDVVIPTGLTNYPTGSTTQDFTIGSGKQMIIEQGARVTLDDLTNNGIIKLNATSAGFASLILNSYSRGGGGSEEIQMFLTGGGTKTPLTYKWHYISPPVTSLAVSTFAPTYTYNIWGWFENRPSTTLSQGWVAYDGYVSSTEWDYPRAFTTLSAGKGYNYFKTTDYTYTFGGLFNTGDVNASLNYTSGNDNLYGYNLLGNPFSSGLDWDYIITHSFPSHTSKGLYFTRNSVLCTYINGVGVPGDVTGIIPPMQGFFSKTYSSGNTIVLAAAARTHDNIHATYKGEKAVIPLVRLELTDDTLSDETVVRFDLEAKSSLDNDFDAVKLFLDPDLSAIYSSQSGIDYCINGQPFPESFIEIPVTVNIVTTAATKTIKATQLQGLDEYNVFLTDNATGFSADLKANPFYTFSALKGTITNRFILKISNVATSIESPIQADNSFNIFHGLGSVNIQTVSDLWDGKSGSVRLLDMTGKSVNDIRNALFSKNSLTSIPAPSAKGLYIVEIQSGMMRYVGKVIVK